MSDEYELQLCNQDGSGEPRRARMDIERTDKTTHVHIRGFHGDGGENEGVLSVIATLDMSPHYPECGRIVVGSPQQSPLMDGYIPDLGLWSCSVHAAERLIVALQEAVRDIRKATSGSTNIATHDQRIAELKCGLVDALYWLKPGLVDKKPAEAEAELERLSNLLDDPRGDHRE